MTPRNSTLLFTISLLLLGVCGSEDSYYSDHYKTEDACKDLIGHWQIPHGGAVTYDDGTTCTCQYGSFTCDGTGFPVYIPLECAPHTNCTCKDPKSPHIFKSGDASNYEEDVCTCVKGYWYCKKNNQQPSDRCIDLDGKFVESGEVHYLTDGLVCACVDGLYRCEFDFSQTPVIEQGQEEEEISYSSCYLQDGVEVLHGELSYLGDYSRCKCYNGKFIECQCQWDNTWYFHGDKISTSPFSSCICGEDGRYTGYSCHHKNVSYALHDVMRYQGIECKCMEKGWECCKSGHKCVKNKARKCLQHSLECANKECLHWQGKCLTRELVCAKYDYKCVLKCCQKYDYTCTKYKRVCGVHSGEYYKYYPFCEKTCIERQTRCVKWTCAKYEHVCLEQDENAEYKCIEYQCKHKCLTHICTDYDVKCLEYRHKGCQKKEEYCKPIQPHLLEIELQ